MVLADSQAFAGRSLCGECVKELGHHAVVGVRKDRLVSVTARRLDQADGKGERGWLEGLPEVAVYM